MSHVKISLRAEQRALRERMRALGMGQRQIAAEFARRFRLRPRAAWRHSHGWSLTEAAEQINAYAASAGLSGGATVAMTAAHLCEHENWPGEMAKPTGRRPTPYLLSLLAAVYGCAVHDLLDSADYERMPAADRLILGRADPVDVPPPPWAIAGDREQLPTGHSRRPLGGRSPVTHGAGIGEHAQGRHVAYAEISEKSPDVSWVSAPADMSKVLTGLLTADMRHRHETASVWAVAVLTEPLGRWLLDPVDPDVACAGRRHVGQGDADAVWSMCSAFADADHRLGGGHARRSLTCYADDVAVPLLSGRYTDQVGRELFAAIARLCDIAGFMCFDSGIQGLGQKYFIMALRMAKVSGSQALGAHILTDMSMQAQHQRHPHEAVALADASVASARRSGSACTLARCQAVLARAFALRGDARDSDHALNQAERSLDRARPDGEPTWMAFFTPHQLAAESAYAAAALHRASLVRRHAAAALSSVAGMQRRYVLVTATLAASYLPSGDARAGVGADIEQACAVLRGILPVIGSQTSARALGLISEVRRRLAGHTELAEVQDLHRDLDQCLADSGS